MWLAGCTNVRLILLSIQLVEDVIGLLMLSAPNIVCHGNKFHVSKNSYHKTLIAPKCFHTFINDNQFRYCYVGIVQLLLLYINIQVKVKNSCVSQNEIDRMSITLWKVMWCLDTTKLILDKRKSDLCSIIFPQDF